MARTKINPTLAKIFTGLHRAIYKLSGGRIGSKIEGGHIIILGTTGRRSGQNRESPVIAVEHATGWVITASNSGHDKPPAWYHNLMANPAGTVQLGSRTHNVNARLTDGEERSQLWGQLVAIYDDFAAYQDVTDREIPVLVLERR